jgi:hypothetical protein
LRKMETTLHQSNISIFHKVLDLLINSIPNNNKISNTVKYKSLFYFKIVVENIMYFANKRPF